METVMAKDVLANSVIFIGQRYFIVSCVRTSKDKCDLLDLADNVIISCYPTYLIPVIPVGVYTLPAGCVVPGTYIKSCSGEIIRVCSVDMRGDSYQFKDNNSSVIRSANINTSVLCFNL